MPAASGTARTRLTQVGLFSQRYGSFAGKTAAVVLEGEPTWTITVQAQNRTITVPAQIRTITVAAPTRTTEV